MAWLGFYFQNDAILSPGRRQNTFGNGRNQTLAFYVTSKAAIQSAISSRAGMERSFSYIQNGNTSERPLTILVPVSDLGFSG